MSGATFEYFMHYKPKHEESIERRHAIVVNAMQQLPQPLSWRYLKIPRAPDCGEHLSAHYEIAYPASGIWLVGDYVYRGEAYKYQDRISYDDKMTITFATSNEHLNYQQMLYQHLSDAISAFGGYLARGFYSAYSTRYHDLHRTKLDRLQLEQKIDLNGRNNIFSLQPTQYWDEELCHKAMGFGRDEVISRLDGKVPLVKPLRHGVYVVFSDNPDLSFEEYCAYNERLKPILGLA